MSFNHEKLKVYQQALLFNAKVCEWTDRWDGRHSVCDQMDRAAGSMIENLAMASAAFSAMKIRGLEYAIGSALECAACLDLAGIKQLLDMKCVWAEKKDLSQIVRMLIGLRRAWLSPAQAREDAAEYGNKQKTLFHHEELNVYQVALKIAATFASSESIGNLSLAKFCRLDELLTSMVLNIAEGNGRFSEADQIRFLGVSHESAIKLAARLDLYKVRGLIQVKELDANKALLARVSAMILALLTDSQRLEDSTRLTTKLAIKGMIEKFE